MAKVDSNDVAGAKISTDRRFSIVSVSDDEIRSAYKWIGYDVIDSMEYKKQLAIVLKLKSS